MILTGLRSCVSPKVVCDISFLLTSIERGLGVPTVLTARFDEILTGIDGGPHVPGYFDLLPSCYSDARRGQRRRGQSVDWQRGESDAR